MSIQEDIGSEKSNKEGNPKNDASKEETVQKLKEFSYYLTTSVENQLSFCLKLLENSPAPKKSNSDAVSALSTIASPIPYLGKGLGTAIKETETYIWNKIDEKNSRTLADLVYFYSDKKEIIRNFLIEASLDLFYSFENQFVRLTCDGGSRRAMQKLAKDATNRIFTYFLQSKPSREFSQNDFTKAVLSGSSIKTKLGIKLGKTVEIENGTKWKTSEIYGNVGVFFEEKGEFFGQEYLETQVFGYRRALDWENYDEYSEHWMREFPSDGLFYTLRKNDFQLLHAEINSYIMKQNVDEEAKLDRAIKHDAILENQQSKHNELLTFLEKFRDIIQEVARNFQEISNKTILDDFKENKELAITHHEQVNMKLTEIYCNVLEAKEGQAQLQHSTEELKNEICVIRNTQSELLTVSQSAKNEESATLADLLKDEVKKLEPKARKELKRFSKKVFGK